MPNDDREADRLDMFHHLVQLVCDGRLHYAPIGRDPQRILDLGTGTGIWAVEMGKPFLFFMCNEGKPLLLTFQGMCIRQPRSETVLVIENPAVE